MAMVRLLPSYKDYLWGGTVLKERFGKTDGPERLAESWEVSARSGGESIVASGPHKGQTLSEYLEAEGPEALGTNCEGMDRFPVLIKLIDAADKLSVQVHPDDEYGLRTENDLGKNEMWYIIDADPEASIYYGVKKTITKNELAARINDNTLEEVLMRVPVKKGESYYIKAGTIHSIGAGIVICEIQQNSNITYRLYDYDRTDSEGNRRELHIEKGCDVADLSPVDMSVNEHAPQDHEGYKSRVLCSCDYFTSVKYDVDGKAVFPTDERSFTAVNITEGTGTIKYGQDEFLIAPGFSFFVPAGTGSIEIKGKCGVIFTTV